MLWVELNLDCNKYNYKNLTTKCSCVVSFDSCLLQIFSTKLNNGQMLHKLRHGVDLSIFCQAPLCGGARFVPVVLPVLLVFNAVLAGLGEWKKQTAKPNAETPWKFSEDLAFRFPHTAAMLHFIIHIINYALPALPIPICACTLRHN